MGPYFKIDSQGSSHCGSVEMSPTSIHEDVGSIPGLTQWVKDLALLWLWLWRRPAAAALIQPLAWEPPYAAGAALKRQNKNKQTKKDFAKVLPLLLRRWKGEA